MMYGFLFKVWATGQWKIGGCVVAFQFSVYMLSLSFLVSVLSFSDQKPSVTNPMSILYISPMTDRKTTHHIEIVEKKMETTTQGLGSRVYGYSLPQVDSYGRYPVLFNIPKAPSMYLRETIDRNCLKQLKFGLGSFKIVEIRIIAGKSVPLKHTKRQNCFAKSNMRTWH